MQNSANVVISNVKTYKNLPEDLKDEIKSDLTFVNPKLAKIQMYSKWGTKEPAFLEYFSEEGDLLIVPRGYTLPFEEVVDDKRILCDVKYPKFKFKLTDLQNKVVKAYMENIEASSGVIVMPTGTGKTVVGTYLACASNQKCLVIVQKNDLIAGWKKVIKDSLGIEPGLIKANKFEIGKQITLSTIQTLSSYNEESLEFIAEHFGMVIVDEFHHSVAKTYNLINKFKAYYRIGLTATPFRNDGLEGLLYHYFGNIAYNASDTSDILPVSIVRRNIKIRYEFPVKYYLYDKRWRTYFEKDSIELTTLVKTAKDMVKYKSCPIENIIRYIEKGVVYGRVKREPLNIGTVNKVVNSDAEFNSKLVQDILLEANDAKSCVVFCKTKEHCETIYNLIVKCFPKSRVQLYYGNSKVKFNDVKERAENKDVLITIATYAIATEGTNVISWERGFLAGTIANKKDLIQCIGRLRRKAKYKKDVLIYDFRFPYVDGLSKHGLIRDKIYRELNFDITNR